MNLKGYRYPKDLILLSVHWYLNYPLSYRNIEEMLGERGMAPDHSSVYRWVQTFTPELVSKFNLRKMPVGDRWRLDETYIKICGQWRYLYRAVHKAGRAVDFLLTAHRNPAAALRFLLKATGRNGVPSLINIDKSGATRPPTPDDWIVPQFRNVQKVRTRSTVSKAFKRDCVATGVTDLTFHSSRHTFITWARRGGARAEVLEKVTHNAKGAIIDQYTHWDWKDLCDAVFCLSSARSGH